MLKAIVQLLLALSIPLLLYMAWIVIRDGRPAPGWFRDAPWNAILISGFCLVALLLGYWALTGTSDPEGAYTPPRVVDGEVVPGKVAD